MLNDTKRFFEAAQEKRNICFLNIVNKCSVWNPFQFSQLYFQWNAFHSEKVMEFYVTGVKCQKDTEKKKRPQITTRTLIFHAKEEET